MEACRISLDSFKEEKALVNVGGGETADELLRELPGMAEAQIYHMPLPELPELEQDGSYSEVAMEKADWKLRNKDYVKQILQCRPEAVYVEGDVFAAYPVVHLLRKSTCRCLPWRSAVGSGFSCGFRPVPRWDL